MPNDELAVREALTAVGVYDPEEIRVARIRDTGHLSEFRVSEALVGEASDAVTVEGWARLSFDDGDAVFIANPIDVTVTDTSTLAGDSARRPLFPHYCMCDKYLPWVVRTCTEHAVT